MVAVIYVVWGPTAEWADGSGPLAYCDTFKGAASYIREERKTTMDYAYEIAQPSTIPNTDGRKFYDWAAQVAGWPTNMVDYWVECEEEDTLKATSGWDGPTDDREAFLEFLNGA